MAKIAKVLVKIGHFRNIVGYTCDFLAEKWTTSFLHAEKLRWIGGAFSVFTNTSLPVPECKFFAVESKKDQK